MKQRSVWQTVLVAVVVGATSLAAQQILSPPKSGLVVAEPDPKPMPAGAATLVGRVVGAGGQTPVPGAFVTLSLAGGERAAVLTGPDGRFVFAAVPAGQFSLTATSAGYLPGAFGRVRPAGPSQLLELVEGQRRADVTLTLWKHAAISGLVIDEVGEPVVNGRLQILRRTIVAGARRLSAGPTVTTDDRGIYRFWGLDPGDYLVALPMSERPDAVADSVGAQTYPATYYLEAMSASRATVIPVASGDERSGIDFSLRPVRAIHVSGTLAGPDGPAAHVPVTLFPSEAADSNSSVETMMVESGADGAFTFANVSPGLYTLRAIKITTAADVAPPVAPLTAVERMMPLASAPILWAEVPVSAGEVNVSGVLATLAPALRVSGSVEFDGADPPRSQLTSLEVFLTPADGRLAALPSRGPVRADGTFATAGLLPGHYLVRVAGQVSGWFLVRAMLDGRDVADVPLEIGSADLAGLVLTYTNRPTRVSGRVTDSAGAADSKASVVSSADSTMWIAMGSSAARMRRVRTTDASTYSVVNLPAGSYYVAAVPDELAADSDDPAVLEALARVATRLEISTGSVKSQDLRVVKIVR